MPEPSYYQHLHDDNHLSVEHLTPIVRHILDDEGATIAAWNSTLLKGIGGGVGGNRVMRIDGTAKSQGKQMTWKVILKVITSQPIDDLTGPHYWLREAEVYRSGFADQLTDHLRPPTCYRVEQPDENTCWLWLEYIEETTQPHWDDKHFVMAARHLGQFNGKYATQHPTYAWMSHNWHRRNLEQVAPLFDRFRTVLSHPLYQLAYTQQTHTEIVRMWDEKEQFLKSLDMLPQTICHYDAFRRNLLIQDDKTFAIDWTFVGKGPIGADLAALLWVSFVFNNISAAQLDSLLDPIYDSYMAGLHDVGYEAKADEVRLGYLASFPPRILISAGYDTLLFFDDSKHEHFESIINMTIQDYMHHNVAAAQPIIQRIAAEARSLVSF